MRDSISLATLMLATLLTGTAGATAEPAPHVRGMNAEARRLLATASTRSSVVQASIDALEATDVVVLLTVEPLSVSAPPGYLMFVSATDAYRYVAVKINSNSFPILRAALLAHELHHALEVASAPEVRDTATLVLLYRRIGYEVGSGKWETDAARSAGALAWRELSGESIAANPAGRPATPGDSARRRASGQQ